MLELGPVFLPGDLHPYPIVHVADCCMLEGETRSPMDVHFIDSEGAAVVIRYYENDDWLLVQEAALDAMAQMTADWRAKGLPFVCRTFCASLSSAA